MSGAVAASAAASVAAFALLPMTLDSCPRNASSGNASVGEAPLEAAALNAIGLLTSHVCLCRRRQCGGPLVVSHLPARAAGPRRSSIWRAECDAPACAFPITSSCLLLAIDRGKEQRARELLLVAR